MDAIQKNIAVARGEAIAANLLAMAALRAILALTPTKHEVLDLIERNIDETLNASGPGRGNADDAFNTQMRETARHMAMQQLDALRMMLPK